MALGPRLDLRQSQSLVMTPQLQQAIKLLALSNLEIETFIGEALDANPLLDIGEATAAPVEAIEGEPDQRRTTLESSPVDQLIGEGRGGEDKPLDIDATALDTDRDTGEANTPAPDYDSPFDGEARQSSGGEAPAIDEHGDFAESLAQHLHAQIGATVRDPRAGFIARFLIDQLDEAGYLPLPLRDVANDLQVALAEVETAL